jgi:hypothetical protein
VPIQARKFPAQPRRRHWSVVVKAELNCNVGVEDIITLPIRPNFHRMREI